MRRTLISAAVLALTLTACGGGDEPSDAGSDESAPTSEAAETTAVTVELRDSMPAKVLSNFDDRTCASKSIADALNLTMANPDASAEEIAAMLPTVSVELANAEGTTIGLQDLEQYGGSFDKTTGCMWTVRFGDVEPSDFYEVTVSKGDEVVATEKAGVPTLVVQF